MTFGRKFYEPLADGAPKPKSEINNDDYETRCSKWNKGKNK